MTSNNTVTKVMEERNQEYQDAWASTGTMIQSSGLSGDVLRLLVGYPRFFFCWVMILNKLIRILGTPNKLDSWVDIAGYAQLVVNDIEKSKGDPNGSSD